MIQMTGGHGHPLNPLFESWKSSWIIVFHQPRLLSILSCVRMVYNHHQDMRWRLSVLHWFWITSPAFIMTTNVPEPGWQLNERHEQQRRRVWVIFSSDSSLCFVSAGLKKMVSVDAVVQVFVPIFSSSPVSGNEQVVDGPFILTPINKY